MTKRGRALVRELVTEVIGEREDAAIVGQVLTTMLQTAVNDFTRYYDARFANNRVREFEILKARNIAAAKRAKAAQR